MNIKDLIHRITKQELSMNHKQLNIDIVFYPEQTRDRSICHS